MSLFQDFKRWITMWALTFAFTFPTVEYPRKILHYLQLFLFRSRSSWIHKEELYGHWIAEDLKKNAKREALSDRISEANVILLWIPGGGFRFDLGKLYTSTFATWIRALEADKGIKSMVFVAKYRHGPEHLFPAAMDDVAKTYDWLVNNLQIDPKKIIIGGDDAGVAIALDTLFIKIPSNQKPIGFICASPYIGLEAGGESWRANLGQDIINEKVISRMENCYMGPEKEDEYDSDKEEEKDTNERKLRPFGYLSRNVEFASFLPSRLLVLLGGKEVLLDEGGILASRARGSGVQVMVIQEPSGVHLWSMLPDIFIKDQHAKQSVIDRFVQFIAETIKH
ncbi:MAG: Alpha/Beta hydrolase protein [Benjaminiella poitrasii]|nr:MAG: Alpha/Beta hydrolase protein [Benjaminiella poitrasii]